MDDVEIVDVDEHGVPEVETLENQDLSFLNQAVGEVLAQYGWYLMVGTVVLYLLIQHYSKRRSSKGPSSSSSPEAQADPVSVVRRQEALEASRRRMQEELDVKAALFQEKQKQLEEEKRRQKIEMWDNMQEGKSSKRTTRPSEAAEEAALKPKSDKKPLRSTGYNPLTGDGGASCSWRPGRRGPSSGG